MRFFISIFLCLGLFVDSPKWAQKIESTTLVNLYKLNNDIYRSEQPSSKQMKELEELGIRTIINFRNLHQDNKELKNTKLISYYLPIKTSKISENDILNALRLIKKAEKPTLIHCWHGSDRTGAVAAAYRMVFENWDKQDAINEFKNGGFGYHENWFPNILTLLQNLNVENLKSEINKTDS